MKTLKIKQDDLELTFPEVATIESISFGTTEFIAITVPRGVVYVPSYSVRGMELLDPLPEEAMDEAGAV